MGLTSLFGEACDDGFPFRFLRIDIRWNLSRRTFGADWDGGDATFETPFALLRPALSEIDGIPHIHLAVHLTHPVRIHSIELVFALRKGRDEKLWTPYLRPKKNQVIADPVFRSPAVIAEGKAPVALVPDLDCISQKTPVFLDADLVAEGGPQVRYGAGAFRTTGHVFFRRAFNFRASKPGDLIEFALFLLPCDADDPVASMTSFVWSRFARRNSMKPQVLPFEAYEREVRQRIFAPDIYREIASDDAQFGAMITQTVTARRTPGLMNAKEVDGFLRSQERLVGLMGFIQKTLFVHPWGYRLLTAILHLGLIKVIPQASFACWFNQVRTALGAALTGETAHVEKAERIVDLVLSAPLENGLRPSICLFPEQRLFWKKGTRAFAMIDRYHLPDIAVTGFHLLEWYALHRPDERIRAHCELLADGLIAHQQPDGSVPSFVDGNGNISPELSRCAATAAPAMFWARMFRVFANERYKDVAERALAFIEREVMPEAKWFDYELQYSCAGRPVPEDGPDRHTGRLPENTLSMYWAAQAALDLGRIDLGETILARLSTYQQVFDHPRWAMDTYGGFAVMNADAEYNDARQGLFVLLYCAYYDATGKSEYFERAIAALRAGFTTMLIPEHRDVAPGNLIHYRESDRGFILENYGHTGRDEMTAGYVSPDWGCGTALYASALMRKRYGQIYVHPERGHAFGIDLCAAKVVSLQNGVLALSISGGAQRNLELVIEPTAASVRGVSINGRALEGFDEAKSRFILSADDITE